MAFFGGFRVRSVPGIGVALALASRGVSRSVVGMMGGH